MSKHARAISANSNATPSGGRFFTARRRVVSDTFISSLSKDGVSRGTIDKIQRDNEKRSTESGKAHSTAEDAS